MSALETEDLSLSYPAVPESVSAARHAASEFAELAGADQSQLELIRLAVSEALANIVLHAYRDQSHGQIHLTAALASGELWVLVADDGDGMHPRPNSPGLGVGLALIAEACEELAIVQRACGGTELRMRFPLTLARFDDDRPIQSRGSVASARRPASADFSTTT